MTRSEWAARRSAVVMAVLLTMSAASAGPAANEAASKELRLPAERSAPSPAAIVIGDPGETGMAVELADSLLVRGVAVFTMEDTDPRASFRERAQAVVAAIATLRARPDIDAKRIALVGIDAGSWVAVLADSASHDVASLVRISGPEVPPAARSLYLQYRDMKAAGFSDSTVSAFGTLHGRLLAYLARRADPPAIRAAIDSTLATREGKRAHRKGWLREWIAYARSAKLAPLEALDVPPWIRDFDFDPGPLSCASPTPTLSIYGAADSTLLVSESANRRRDSLDFCSGTVGDVWVVEGADHAIRVAKDVKRPAKRAPADTYFDRVAAWIKTHAAPAADASR